MLAASLLQGMCAGRVRVSVWVTLEIYFNPANRRRLRVHAERWKMAESRSPQRTIRLYVTRNSSALADTAMSGGKSASSASWYKCRSSTDISPALLNSLPSTMIMAFSFAANRAPEWSSAGSSTARSYAALTSDDISSAFAYSRPLNRMLVLVLAFTIRTSSDNYFSRNSSMPSFASTWTAWPSRTLPSRISMLSGSRISLWMARRKGRAP